MSRRATAKLALVGLVTLIGAALGPQRAEAKGAGALAGKVFFSPTKPKDAAPSALMRLFASSKPQITLTQNDEKEWTAVLVAFFRKPAIAGPVTLWFYDKTDKVALKAKEPVHIVTAPAAKAASALLVHDLLLRPDDGFNKGHTLLVMVGQIIGKREQVYARGEIKLK